MKFYSVYHFRDETIIIVLSNFPKNKLGKVETVKRTEMGYCSYIF